MEINDKRKAYLTSKIQQQGLTLIDFASKIDMPYSTLRCIVANTESATMKNVDKICEGLHITLDEFMHGQDDSIEHRETLPALISILNDAQKLTTREQQEVLNYIRFLLKKKKPT